MTIELLHRCAAIEFMTQAVELPLQVAAVSQPLGRNSLGKDELAGQLQTLHWLVTTAQLARAIDVGCPGGRQSDKGRQVGVVGPAKT